MPRSKTAPWTFALAGLFCAVGLWSVIGHFWFRYRVNHDVQTLQGIVASLAQSDPAYANLKAVQSTHPKIWIFGTVESSERIEAVRAKVAEHFGAKEARRIVSQIRLPIPAATRPNQGSG